MRALHTGLMCRYPVPLDSPVCGLHQSYGNPTIDVSARPRVGLPSLCFAVAGYPFQGSRRLHTQYPIKGVDKCQKMSILLEACLQVHFFFDRSSSWRHFSGVFAEWDLASVLMTRMSWTLSVPLCQRSRISRWPLCSVAYIWFVYGVVLDVADFAFVLFMAQPAKMRGSSLTWFLLKAFPDRSATHSLSSLLRSVMRPLLQSRE